MIDDCLQKVDDSLVMAQSRMDTARDHHSALGSSHTAIEGLHQKLVTAIGEGDRDAAQGYAEAMRRSLTDAQGAHRDVGVAHDGVQRSLDGLKLGVEAIRNGSDGYTNPTKTQAEKAGGMTSDGPSINGVPGGNGRGYQSVFNRRG
jgi:hypothetical protein